MNQHVCELCYPYAREIAEIFPGGWLVENEGKWSLMAGQGHRDDELLFFPDKPTPNPDPEFILEHEAGDEADRWIDKVTDWADAILLSPTDGHFLVNGCYQAGCEVGYVCWWLYDHCGKVIEESEHGKK